MSSICDLQGGDLAAAAEAQMAAEMAETGVEEVSDVVVPKARDTSRQANYRRAQSQGMDGATNKDENTARKMLSRAKEQVVGDHEIAWAFEEEANWCQLCNNSPRIASAPGV